MSQYVCCLSVSLLDSLFCFVSLTPAAPVSWTGLGWAGQVSDFLSGYEPEPERREGEVTEGRGGSGRDRSGRDGTGAELPQQRGSLNNYQRATLREPSSLAAFSLSEDLRRSLLLPQND